MSCKHKFVVSFYECPKDKRKYISEASCIFCFKMLNIPQESFESASKSYLTFDKELQCWIVQ